LDHFYIGGRFIFICDSENDLFGKSKWQISHASEELPLVHCVFYTINNQSITKIMAPATDSGLIQGRSQGNHVMMRLKVAQIGQGLHPSETVVSVQTRTGPEEVVVDPRSLRDNSVNVGWPVGREGKFLLVELPRPTSRGYKRVWVNKDDLVPDEAMRALA
jgi:hypothetical protein